MSYRRSIIARTKLFYQQQQRFAPSFSHISSRDREEQPPKSICRNSQFLISRNYATNPLLSGGNVTRLMRSEVPARYGLNFRRNLSNVPLDGAIGVQAAPVVNEVAVAAADSLFPVAALQHLIDYVHCYTGLEWWASIAATTLLIRVINLPSSIFTLRVFAFLHLHRSALAERMRTKDREKIKAFNQKFANQFSYINLKIHGQFVLFASGWLLLFAILNMAEKVPSFTTGGTLWFTDLTTPDRMHLPLLWALTMWSRIQLDPRFYQLGGKRSYKRTFLYSALLGSGAVAAGFPTAVYCSGITSNIFSIALGKVLRYPRVRKLLDIPEIAEKSC